MKGNTYRGTTGRLRAALSAAVVVCAVTALPPTAASAEPTAAAGLVDTRAAGDGVERISAAADGTQGSGDSVDASITPDGRHVVFASAAGNLTSDQATGGPRVFVRDQRTGHTKRLGYLPALAPPAISGDGEYVAYTVRWEGHAGIREFQVGTGRQAAPTCIRICDQPTLNADGHFLAFVDVRNRRPVDQRIEVQGRGGAPVTVATLQHIRPARPSISGDGRRLAYQDDEAGHVFVWDRTSGTTSGPIGGTARATLVQLSDDGTEVVYLSGSDTRVHDVASGAEQVVPHARGVAVDPSGRYLLYAPQGATGPSLVLRDLRAGTDRTVADQPASAGLHAVSAGGRDVVFQSTAGGIVPGEANGKSQLFVRHFG
ncbi:hypothetical protein AB0O91_01515 [Kitasatospora sp. NPDC089797]|uniref:TolB family protein n=1 Tax=Kitasatospora sp. NPDC089797 TaxID=3155298 RepID=UPI003425EEE4